MQRQLVLAALSSELQASTRDFCCLGSSFRRWNFTNAAQPMLLWNLSQISPAFPNKLHLAAIAHESFCMEVPWYEYRACGSSCTFQRSPQLEARSSQWSHALHRKRTVSLEKHKKNRLHSKKELSSINKGAARKGKEKRMDEEGKGFLLSAPTAITGEKKNRFHKKGHPAQK